jgi:molecular chaperone DnaK
MNISAKDKKTGKENKITIKSNSGLSDAEIQQMVKDAEDNAEADKKARELIEARNGAEGQLHNLRKDLAEHGDKVTAEQKTAIEDGMKDLEEVIKGDDATKITETTTKLWETMKPLFDAKMAAEQAKAEAEAPKENDAADATVDAAFKEV